MAGTRSLFVLGQGGMGLVEAAVREEGGATEIVVAKRLLPGADERRRAMFRQEATVALRLRHPNVVRALAFDEDAAEGPTLLLEYLEGETLAEVFTSGPLPPELLAFVLAEVCRGLHGAHELTSEEGDALSLVHRDVSPQNVFVTYGGEVKLLDFGVAKLEDKRHLTRTGEVKGKMAYMAPEQAMGDGVDRRSDLFGVGALLFEGLVGGPPWGGGTDVDVLRRIALGPPPDLGATPPSTPPPLRDLTARLLAPKAADRPTDAAEVATALDALVRETEQEGGAPSPSEKLRQLMAARFGNREHERKARLAHALGQGPALPVDPPPAGATRGLRPWMAGLLAVPALVVVAVAARQASVGATSATPTAPEVSASPRPSVVAPALPPPAPPLAASGTEVPPPLASTPAALRPGPAPSVVPTPPRRVPGTAPVVRPAPSASTRAPVRPAPTDVDPAPF